MLLRPMTMDDADFMLELKNYPETRKNAIASQDEIKKEDHYKWLPENLKYFSIIYKEETGIVTLVDDIGAIRIQDNEISIWIDREHWGKGIASTILSQVATPGMTAKIVAENIGSMNAFIKAGFRPVGFRRERDSLYEQFIYYIFKKYK